jgi:hypothetical protein
MLGISRAKAHEIVADGRVRSVWLDGARLIPIADARTFAEKLTGNSPADKVPA